MLDDIDMVRVDVLIIGGGFAGTFAALSASEHTDSVLLVDKAFVSRSGASTISGGVTTCPLPSDNLDTWAKEFVTRGHYMCDYRWTQQVLEGQIERVRQFAEWGVPIVRDDKGNISRFASRGMIDVRCMEYSPKKAMEALRAQVLARGVKILDRVHLTGLITSDGEYPTSGAICGAIGFTTRGGRAMAILAKRTIIATGPMAMKGVHRIDNCNGEGFAMAYRAGARLVDLEFSFGGTFSVLMRHFKFGNYNVAVAHGARLINEQGERFMAKYDPVRLERSELGRVVAGFAKELIDGRGPVYVDLRHCDEDYWKALEAVAAARGSSILLSNRIPNPRITPLPIEPTWGMWNGSRSGLKIDLGGRATLPGLLCAGSCAKNSATGTHASAGIPTAWAYNTGHVAGHTAGREAKAAAPVKIAQSIIRRLADTVMAPLSRPGNGWEVDALHDKLARLECSVVDMMALNEAKLDAKVAETEEVSAAAADTRATSLHDLMKLHEAESIAENARLVYLASRDRTESREQFHREDYPATDDVNWFCWHGISRGPTGPVFDKEPIPVETMPFPIQHTKADQISPLAAILSGTYQREHYT